MEIEQDGERRQVVLTAPAERTPVQIITDIERAMPVRILWMYLLPMENNHENPSI